MAPNETNFKRLNIVFTIIQLYRIPLHGIFLFGKSHMNPVLLYANKPHTRMYIHLDFEPPKFCALLDFRIAV